MSAEDRPAPPEQDKLADLAREAPTNGVTLQKIVDAAVARGIASDALNVSDPDGLESDLDIITADALNAIAKLVEIAINQQGIDAQFGIADWELVELIFQAPVMRIEYREASK